MVNWLHKMGFRLRELWQRREVKQEIDEELRFHLEQRPAENIAAGMAPEDAAREARKRFGNRRSVREECREAQGARLGQGAGKDVRFAVRKLLKRPGFTAVAAVSLALGIGANTVVFSVAKAVLFRPLGFAEADQLTWLQMVNPQKGGPDDRLSWREIEDIRESTRSFEARGTFWVGSMTWEQGDQVERRSTLRVTPRLEFPLERAPTLGTGSVLTAGVRSFRVPMPQPTGSDFTSRDARMFLPVARLKPGATEESARAELAVLGERLATDHPETNRHWRFDLVSFRDQTLGQTRRGIPLLAGLGDGLGILLARGALHGIRGLASASVPFIREAEVDGTALAFTTGLSLLTALVFGLLPALWQSRVEPVESLRAE